MNKRPAHNNLRIITRLALITFVFVQNAMNVNIANAGRASDSGTYNDPVWGMSVNNVPAWLVIPANESALRSEYELKVLAGHLINTGDVDARDCPNAGLNSDGTANTCGIQRAKPQVTAWQNQFDKAILSTSKESGVPPYLLKNIFAWESQFWPVTTFKYTSEYGLGHMTEMGADSLLRWNPSFYLDFCSESLPYENCRKLYIDQQPYIQSMLRGLLVQKVRGECPNCKYGLDLPHVEKSIPFFAETLVANASYIALSINFKTGKEASSFVSYEDLWKFTLTSYNAGPGCFSTALTSTLSRGQKVTWDNLSRELSPGCRGAVDYVNFVSNIENYKPAPATATANPLPSATATLVPATATEDRSVPLPTGATTPEATSSPEVPSPGSGANPTGTPPTVEGTPSPIETVATNVTPTETTPLVGTATPVQTPTAPVEPTVPGVTAVPTEIPPTAEPTPTETAISEPHVADEIIVKVSSTSELAQELRPLGVNIYQDSEAIENINDATVLQVPADEMPRLLNILQESDAVEFAEPNFLVKIASTPNDPGFGLQTPYLLNIQVPQAWDTMTGYQEIPVAVIDTGVDFAHPDLSDVIWLSPGETGLDADGKDKRFNGIDDDANGYVDDWHGWNMVSGNNNPSDNQGHGTHTAGIIGAAVNNAVGIAGIAPNARIMPIKVLDGTGYGTYANVAEGIVYATDMGARIINLGFAGEGSSQLMQDAVNYALAHGVIVVAAAGNSGQQAMMYPAGYPGVLAISSVDNGMLWLPFSTWGDHISLSAPGSGIYSTAPGGQYQSLSGTSMSAAQVSGIATMLLGSDPIKFPDADSVRSALIGGALDLGNPGRDSFYGYGMVRALDALAYAGPILPTPTPWIVPTSTPGGSGGVFAMSAPDVLWARNTPIAQSCFFTATLTNPAFSTDGAFNNQAATCSGLFGAAVGRRWTFTSFDDPTVTAVVQATLNIRISFTPTDDEFDIQIYDASSACASRWCTIGRFSANTGTGLYAHPTSLTTIPIDVTAFMNSISDIQAAGVRISSRNSGPNGIAENVTISIDEISLTIIDALATPTPTPAFVPTSTIPATRAITATPISSEPHNHFTMATDLCASCHRTHSAQIGDSLQVGPTEEQTCYACHSTSGPGTNIQPAFTSYTNTATRFFKHDVANTLEIHTTSENSSPAFGGANRHVECGDCHEAHSTARTNAGTGSVNAPEIPQEMFHSTGIDPNWTATGAPTSFTWLTTANREYQVCLKCHSSYTTQPTYSPDGYFWNVDTSLGYYIANGLAKLDNNIGSQVPDSRDMAKEFNTYQVSFHPVAALGRNQDMPAGSFMPGWSQTSTTYCADCHENANAALQGEGTHGSPLLHLLDGGTNYITAVDAGNSCIASEGCPQIHNAGELCFKCHQFGTYATGSNAASTTHFKNGAENLHSFHSFTACYTCHDTHGSEQQHLINFDTSIVTITTGNSQTAWQWNGTTGSCGISCHGAGHSPTLRQYTP